MPVDFPLHHAIAPPNESLELPSKAFIQKWQTNLAIEGRIECWTILERATWQLLEAHGTLTCPVAKADDDPIFQQAYDWMKTSMVSADIHPPAPGLSPWWCWIRRQSDCAKPYIEDLSGLDDPVVLQLSVPNVEIVASCFDLWHYVLNRWYIYASESDELEFDQERAICEESSQSANLLDARMRASWCAVFDLGQTSVDMGPFEKKSIQGCFWVLREEDVTAVLEPAALSSYDH
ncbi:DUF3841 domain-containing protein [Pseudomonas sp. RIT-To-2]|uniref:DUF3841 domain-containing protein n=1 Tax=Pseudomonas sp. RIT-To-2 TaxID=3462541 RepID=UPI0024131006